MYKLIFKLNQVRKAVKRLMKHGAEFMDNTYEDFDAVILATGYKSNVPYWLKVIHIASILFHVLDCCILMCNNHNSSCSSICPQSTQSCIFSHLKKGNSSDLVEFIGSSSS